MASSEQNKAMAKRMKDEGVRRTHGRCPICNTLIGIKALAQHIIVHK